MSRTPLVLVANAGDGSISTFRREHGALTRIAVTPGLTGCSAFAVDTERDIVYAGVKRGQQGEPAGILSLDLNRDTGALTPRARLDLPDGAMSYLALTRDGSGLLGASYGGGYGIVCRIHDGVLGEPASRIEYPHLHSVLASDDGRFAYFVSLGADLVAQYSLDDELQLHPLDPATVAAPAGSGPRHLVLTRAQDFMHVVTEFSGEVLHLGRDTETGVLELQGATSIVDPAEGLGHSEIGADPVANHFIWGADLHLGDGDRRLWASERTGSTLGAATVADDGSVSPPKHFTKTEPQPRGFAVSPDGSLLVAGGELSRTISLYAVDGDRLELLQQAETGRGANWVRFV